MRKLPYFIALLGIVTLCIVGCDRLQAGYYLTPEHFPTLPTEATSPASATHTPLSTIFVVDGSASATPIIPTLTPTEIVPSATPTALPCVGEAGQVLDEALFSAQVGANVRYSIYLPPCYAQSQRRYPVLYMLHGYHPTNPSVMDNAQWIRMGLPDAADQGYSGGSLPPMIIVMPNGNDSGYDFDAGPFPEFVVNDLIPAIDQKFCTWNDPAMRAIGGLSRGGFFAYWIAFRYPEMFARVGGHSPFFYEPGFTTDENPFNLVDTAPIGSLAMYMDHGGFNREIVEVQPGVEKMLMRLKARGFDPVYVANSVGDHDEAYWSSHTADYLAFYAEAWPLDTAQSPTCSEPSP